MADKANSHAYRTDVDDVELIRSQERRQKLYVIKKQKQKAKTIHKEKVVLFTSVIVLFLVALCFTAMQAKINNCGYTINNLKEQTELVESQSERLEMEIESARSLSQIEAYATANLGMVYPSNKDVAYINYSGLVSADTNATATITASAGDDKQVTAVTQMSDTPDTFLNSIGKMLSDFFTRQASAAEIQ